MGNTISTDVAIIGGGPAGSIAAANLIREGFQVTIVEKEKFPRFVIGESLLPRCNEILENAGVLDAIEAQGYIKKGGALFKNKNRDEEIFHFSQNLGQKWTYTYQVKREEFDTVLLEEAVKKGASILRETEVTSYHPDTREITYKDREGNQGTIESRFVLDASGYGRVLPKLLGLDRPSHLPLRRATFARFKNDVRPEGYNEGYIHIYIYGNNEGWVWVIPFHDGITSVGIVCTEEFFESFGMNDEQFFNHIINQDPNARERLQGAERIVPVNSISGYSASISSLFGEGYALAGNATEFLDPVFSSGVTLALESGDRAAKMIARELRGERVDWKTEYEDYMMKGVNVFREFVLAWYDGRLQQIFFHHTKPEDVKASITSVLAGFVWDERNLFVKDPQKALNSLAAFTEK